MRRAKDGYYNGKTLWSSDVLLHADLGFLSQEKPNALGRKPGCVVASSDLCIYKESIAKFILGTVFGYVTEGMDIVDAIESGDAIFQVTVNQ